MTVERIAELRQACLGEGLHLPHAAIIECLEEIGRLQNCLHELRESLVEANSAFWGSPKSQARIERALKMTRANDWKP